ncbi:DUF6302 family protein [Streptomyces sp. NPDC088560]|uniref:DUF6302 family protein n=1 Tax=Streptomyces sp. NPDC088560 TaxID=3365868 RepID=UPI00382B6A37
MADHPPPAPAPHVGRHHRLRARVRPRCDGGGPPGDLTHPGHLSPAGRGGTTRSPPPERCLRRSLPAGDRPRVPAACWGATAVGTRWAPTCPGAHRSPRTLYWEVPLITLNGWRPSPAVEVRPADARDEWEVSWFREQLADPSLIGAGVVVVVDGMGFLAVPVGGRRRGGYLAASDRATACCLRDALAGRPGYPDVRVHWVRDARVCHAVRWGGDAPDGDDDRVIGAFYGYSEQATKAYLKDVAHLTT